jgi:hypothetical protein
MLADSARRDAGDVDAGAADHPLLDHDNVTSAGCHLRRQCLAALAITLDPQCIIEASRLGFILSAFLSSSSPYLPRLVLTRNSLVAS